MFTGIKHRFAQLIVLSIVIASCNNTEAPKQEVTDTTAQTNMEASSDQFSSIHGEQQKGSYLWHASYGRHFRYSTL